MNKPQRDFYSSKKWRALAGWVRAYYPDQCMRCGAKKHLQVDHIKPRSLYPKLALEFDNQQILCGRCNRWKSNTRIIDFRKSAKRKRFLCKIIVVSYVIFLAYLWVA